MTTEKQAACIEVAREIGARCADPERLHKAIEAAKRQTGYPLSAHWNPMGVAQGDAGLAVMFGCLDSCFPGEGWDLKADMHIKVAARDAEGRPAFPTGLFDGLSGLAFAVWYNRHGGTRYQKLIRTLDDALVPRTLEAIKRLFQQTSLLPVGHWDLISGLSGVGAYLLLRRDNPEVCEALQALLACLVRLSEDHENLPRCYTPPKFIPDNARARYPGGQLNFGLAHGIPGALSLLSVAALSGVEVEEMKEAIERLANYLFRYRLEDEWGVNWPMGIPGRDAGSGSALISPSELEGYSSLLEPCHAGWCYGSPGVARSIWHAGRALEKSFYKNLAIEAMKAVFKRPPEARFLVSPTFCHGFSGLLQITFRFFQETGDPSFAEAIDFLTNRILSEYEPESILGCRAREPEGRKVDQPGLLDGAPGVALALLAAAGIADPSWDRLFLIC